MFALPLLGLLFHYPVIHCQQVVRAFQPPLQVPVELIRALGHAFLGVMLAGMLGAVLIPNVLGAKRRAAQFHEQNVVRDIENWLNTRDPEALRSGPCARGDIAFKDETWEAPWEIASCTVTAPADDEPELDVTFSGRTVHLP